LGIALAPLFSARAATLPISEFSGLNTEASPATLQNGQTPDSENVVTDEFGGLQPRQGFTLCHASSSTAQWLFPHSNGTIYQVIQTGGLLKADTGGCTFDISISTVDVQVKTAAASLGDRFYFTNTTDGLKYWDISSVAVASASIAATQLVAHKARLWAAGIAASPRTVFASAFGDAANWNLAVDPAVTDPAQFVIGGASGFPLTTLYTSHQDALVWMTSRSFGAISGNSRVDFTVRTYSDNVGTAYPDSVQNCDGLLRFLGPARTIYEWNGAELVNIGSVIKTYLGQIGQGDANRRTYTITDKPDYDAGTSHQLTTAITSGDIMLSTWTETDTLDADFSAGTTSNTSVIGDRVYLSTNNTNVTNNSFEDSGCFGSEWTATAGDPDCFTTGSPKDGSQHVRFNTQAAEGVGSLTVEILDTSNNILTSNSYSTVASYTQRTISLSSYIGRYLKIKIYRANSSSLTLISPVFLCSGGDLTFWQKGDAGGHYIDLFEGGRSTTYSGTFTSAGMDTSLSSAAWTATGANWTTNLNAISVQTQSSSDGSSWQSAVSWSTGSAPASDFRRHIRYVITLSTGGTTNSTALPYVEDVTLAARANYGAFISSPIAIGSPTSLGLFSAVTDDDGGTVAYAVYSDTDTSMTISGGVPTAGFVSSQTITSGAYVSLSTAPYLRLGETMTISSGVYNPTNHSLNVNWAEGNTTAVPSAWFRQRYWLGVSYNSTTNNRILVFDKNRQWQRYSGINAASLGIYSGNLFFGNDDGVYQYETGYTDAGSDIAAYYRTPTFSPSGPNLSSVFNDVQITTDESEESLVTTFQVNGAGTDYSLSSKAMNDYDGIQNFRLSFPFTQIQQGRNISLEFAVTGGSFWRILGATLDFVPDIVPE
jgi:hypothetical protein